MGVRLSAALCVAAMLGPALAPVTAAQCDRACLQGVAETYLSAMLAHDPGKAPLARDARYTENGVELRLPDGLWRTVDKVGSYRLYVADPQGHAIGFFAKAQENGAPVLVGTRLKVEHGKITQIESVVGRLSSTLGGSPFGLPKGQDPLDGSPRPQFLTSLPTGKRRSREQLAAIVNTYFTGIENNSGDKPPLFAPDCHRLENLTATTNVPLAPGRTANSMNYSCAQAFELGFYHEDTRMRNRRILAVDVERGLVYAGIFLDHDATVRSYKLRDGRTQTVKNTGPWTWDAQEIFQVNADGKISQVEAVLLSVPYGMRPGWSTGVHLPSPAARKDGFKEY